MRCCYKPGLRGILRRGYHASKSTIQGLYAQQAVLFDGVLALVTAI